MSFPSDGFESAFRHHIDDVSSVIENCHSGHYAVVNLTERRYHVAKFHTGIVIDAGKLISVYTNTVTVRIPDGSVFKWSFSGQYLCPVFECIKQDGQDSSKTRQICPVF
jgi:hypothetical protein